MDPEGQCILVYHVGFHHITLPFITAIMGKISQSLCNAVLLNKNLLKKRKDNLAYLHAYFYYRYCSVSAFMKSERFIYVKLNNLNFPSVELSNNS